MTKTITAEELQENLPALLDAQDPLIIEADGQPVAALVPFEEWQAYQKHLEEKRERYKRFQALKEMAATNAAHNDLTEAEAMELAVRVCKEVRAERYLRDKMRNES